MPTRHRSVALAEIEVAPASPFVSDARAQAALADFAILAATIDTAPAPIEAATDKPVLARAIGQTALAEPNDAPSLDMQEAQAVITVRDFTDIFERFQTPIINFIYRLIGNREEAYDLAQDAFVKAFRALDGGDEILAGAFSSWLYRIASNTATDALRRRRLKVMIPLSLFNEDRGVGAGMPDARQAGYTRDAAMLNTAVAGDNSMGSYSGGRFENRIADREIIERVLGGMPQKYRAALLLYEHEGLSVAEAAEVLRVTPSAIKMRLMRARERFIELYEQETGEHPGQVFVPRRSKHTVKRAAPVLVAV